MAGPSHSSYATCLGIRIVSDLLPVIRTMTESLGEGKGCTRLKIFRITGESIITGYPDYRSPDYRVPAMYVYTSVRTGGL